MQLAELLVDLQLSVFVRNTNALNALESLVMSSFVLLLHNKETVLQPTKDFPYV